MTYFRNNTLGFLSILVIFGLLSCTAPSSGGSGGGTELNATAKFTSSGLTDGFGVSSFSGPQVTPKSITIQTLSGTHVIPNNLTGKAVALIYTTGPNEGFDVFGPERPDQIQPDDSDLVLVPFDLSEQLSITGTTELSDNYVGAETSNMELVIGYMDFHIALDSVNLTASTNVIRIAFGSVEGMIKGDKLMKFGDTFKWYDTDSLEFVTTRPTNPAKVSEIASFDGSEHQPDMHFYSISVEMTEAIDLTRSILLSGNGILNTLDFSVNNLLLIEDMDDVSEIDDVELITAATLSENARYGAGGVTVTASITIL
ncbi:MAG: hypothetical protein O3A01_06985 [bacterium]|nr:hypothetical protein [bacterium]